MPRKVKRKKKEEVGLAGVTGSAQSATTTSLASRIAKKVSRVIDRASAGRSTSPAPRKPRPERPTPELDLPSVQQVINKVNNMLKRKPDTASRSRPVRKRKK